MDHYETLTRSSQNFSSLLSQTTESDLSRPTPCENWSVGELLWHVARASDMTVLLLDGGTRDDAIRLFEIPAPLDVVAQCHRALEEQMAGFRTVTDLEAITHHPMGDVTVAQLFDFRIMDLTLHYWDLARAIGADEEIPSELVTYVYAMLLPLEEVIEQTGIFGVGPSHALEENASTQTKLLDLSGRRP